MSILRVILGDQLSGNISSLREAQPNKEIILMCEVAEECSYVKHHKKKIILVLAAMRHFSQKLIKQGYQLDYIELEDPENTGSIVLEIRRAVLKHQPLSVMITSPGEYRLLKALEKLKETLSVPLNISEDNRFLSNHREFHAWAQGKKTLRMEFFYRELRLKYNILMDGEKPEGGKWNYDAENRKFPKNKLNIPSVVQTIPDPITQGVIHLVAKRFPDHFGDIEPFFFAVTREQALTVLHKFIKERLSYFGDYQDAMIENEPWLFHSHLSFYLNIGLLEPLECIKSAEKAYYEGRAPLNSAEGFIRQILGWREYVRGIYWLKMPEYQHTNYFDAHHKLPDFYWTANTKMNCLKQCVTETKKNAYAHHIQRLMVLGNFALLAGISPKEVNEWFLIVYADAFEWVELPNVTGMILFADGGFLASKPYAAGGAYIHKMSNYCENCHYKVALKNGEAACPFNYLYWDFLIRHEDKLKNNQRLSMIYHLLSKMTAEKIKLIQADSQKFLQSILPPP